jgi:Uma2 family endonuclease
MKSSIDLPPRYSVADYQKWEGDWELINGYPYAMASATRPHQLLAGRIFGLIQSALNWIGY